MTQPTIGSNVEEIKYKNIKFTAWDVGGQESLRASWSVYYSDCKVAFTVFRAKRLDTSRPRRPC